MNTRFRTRIGAGVRKTLPGLLEWRDHRRGRNATNYTEKLIYKIRYDRDPLLTVLSDKLAVRDYVAKRIGEKYLPKVYASGTIFDPEWLTGLPSKFVIKTNHGSGALIVVSDAAPANEALPANLAQNDWSTLWVRRENLDLGLVASITTQWLSQNFGRRGAHFEEWGYSQVVPRVFIEEFLEGPDGDVATDYKVWTFNGSVQAIAVIEGRFTGFRIAIMSPQWQRIPVEYNGMEFAPLDAEIPRPRNLALLLELCERIAKDLDQARIDFYDTEHGLKFGECTNYSLGGNMIFEPASFNQFLGKDWHPDYRGKRQ